MEALAIISSVAAVVSAFQNGSTMIQNIRARRAARQASPILAELERSIEQAPGEIEAEKQRGVSRFGRAFEEGDEVAEIVILRVTVQFQNSLLSKLSRAAADDTVVDFTTLADDCDIARNRVRRALFDLYDRLIERTRLIPESDTSNSTLSLVPTPGRRLSLPASPPANAVVPSSRASSNGSIHPESRQQQARRPSLARVFRRNRSEIQQSQPESNVDTRSTPQSEASLVVLSRRQTLPTLTRYTYEDGEDDPSRIWGDDSTESVSGTSDELPASNHIPDLPNAMPTSDNNFRGLCKSAWKFQNGDQRALQRTAVPAWEPDSSARSNARVYYFSCKTCLYRCRMTRDRFQNEVRTLEPRGIQFRWSFLVKSHKCHKLPASMDYTFVCLFCVFLGLETSPMKVGPLFDHISAKHRGTDLGEIVLNRTGCVNDRLCGEDESFDINLWPIDGGIRRASLASAATTSSGSTRQVRNNGLTGQLPLELQTRMTF